MTDFRSICAELLREFEHATHDDYQQELKHRARAALAEPQPEPATDKQLSDTYWGAYHRAPERNNGLAHAYALRAVLACWGNDPESPDRSTEPTAEKD